MVVFPCIYVCGDGVSPGEGVVTVVVFPCIYVCGDVVYPYIMCVVIL